MVNEGFDFTSELKTLDYSHETVDLFLTVVDHRRFCAVHFHLNPESLNILGQVAGYIVANVQNKCGTCCKDKQKKNSFFSGKAHLGLLSERGL